MSKLEHFKAFRACSSCLFDETKGQSDGIVCPDCGKFLDIWKSFKITNDRGRQTYTATLFTKAIP